MFKFVTTNPNHSGYQETRPVPLFIKHLRQRRVRRGRRLEDCSPGLQAQKWVHPAGSEPLISMEGCWGKRYFSKYICKGLWLTEGFETILREILLSAAPNEDPQWTDQEMGSWKRRKRLAKFTAGK